MKKKEKKKKHKKAHRQESLGSPHADEGPGTVVAEGMEKESTTPPPEQAPLAPTADTEPEDRWLFSRWLSELGESFKLIFIS